MSSLKLLESHLKFPALPSTSPSSSRSPRPETSTWSCLQTHSTTRYIRVLEDVTKTPPCILDRSQSLFSWWWWCYFWTARKGLYLNFYFYIVRVLSILTNPYQALKVIYKTVNNIKKWKPHRKWKWSHQTRFQQSRCTTSAGVQLTLSTELPTKQCEGGVAAELDLAASNWNP